MGRSQVHMFKPRKDYVRSEVCLIRQGLFGRQEPKSLCGQVLCWETCAIVSVFKDDSNTVGCVGQLSKNTLLKKWQSGGGICFTTLQDYDRTTRLVVCRIKEVSQVERGIRVGLILGFVVEMVYRNGDVMGRI